MPGFMRQVVQLENGMEIIFRGNPTSRLDGVGPQGIPDIFTPTSSQEWPLGTELLWGDDEYVYALNGATALAVGVVVQTAVRIVGHQNRPMKVAAAAATTVRLDPVTTSITANQYRDGYWHSNDVDGEGQIRRVTTNGLATHDTADDADAGQWAVITLETGLKVALTANSEGTLTKNKYDQVVVAPITTLTGKPLGTTPVAVTADYYFWIHKKGPMAVLASGTVVIGNLVVTPSGVEGGIGPQTIAYVTKEHIVGEVLNDQASTEYPLIDGNFH